MKRATPKAPRQTQPATVRKPRKTAEDRFNELLSQKYPYVTRVVQSRYRTIDPAIIEEGVQEARFQFWKLLKKRKQLHQAKKHIGLLVKMAKQEVVRLARSYNRLVSLDELTNDPASGGADRPDSKFYDAQCNELRGRLLPVIGDALQPELFGTLTQFACDLGCAEPEEVFDFLYGLLFGEALPVPRKRIINRLCLLMHKKQNAVYKALSRARRRYLSAMATAPVYAL
jgi:DNA-directed RNA polymerase specialized sigma24 family protein